MKLDYMDIGAIIERTTEEALRDGESLTTIEELLEYLDEGNTFQGQRTNNHKKDALRHGLRF